MANEASHTPSADDSDVRLLDEKAQAGASDDVEIIPFAQGDVEPGDRSPDAPANPPASPKEDASTIDAEPLLDDEEPDLTPRLAALAPEAPGGSYAVDNSGEEASPARPAETNPAAARDRIVILGRRRSGKTTYLATLYANLWRNIHGLTAKALTGEVHKYLMGVYETLATGSWPPATLGMSRLELELADGDFKRLLVTLDFPGELFTRAFIDERLDWPGARQLTEHIDRAAAVLLMVDPTVAVGLDRKAALEDDFGLVQAAQRIRSWPGGENVPIVIVLTKIDAHRDLIDRHGGPVGFVREHFPALVRLLRTVAIFETSSVQVEMAPDGSFRPIRNFASTGIQEPVTFCLARMRENDERQTAKRRRAAIRKTQATEEKKQVKRERQQDLMLTVIIGIILAVGFIALMAVLFFKT